MQYLVSVIDDTAGLATPDEMAAINAFNDRLKAEGHWVFAGGLAAPSVARTAYKLINDLMGAVQIAAAAEGNSSTSDRLFGTLVASPRNLATTSCCRSSTSRGPAS